MLSIHRSGGEHDFPRPPCYFLPPSVPILEIAVDLRMLLGQSLSSILNTMHRQKASKNPDQNSDVGI